MGWALASNIDRLVTALTEEFSQEGKQVQLHLAVPAQFTVPSVVVAPGDPFIEPRSLSEVRERWEVLVVFNSLADDRNVAQMRLNSLRVRRAALSVGALWEQTGGIRRASNEPTDTTALVPNTVIFPYNPDGLLDNESE